MIIMPLATGSGIGTLIGYYLLLLYGFIAGIPKYSKARKDIKNNKVDHWEKLRVIAIEGDFSALKLMQYRLLDFGVTNFFISISYSKTGLTITGILTLIITFYFFIIY